MFTTFATYQLASKTIRVIEDAKEKNHKYVVEDVMCIFFDNGHNYWKELKQQLPEADSSLPSAYSIIITNKGTIDVATREQLLQIISYIPHRKSKKGMVKVWLGNHFNPNQSVIQHINSKPVPPKKTTIIEPEVSDRDNNDYSPKKDYGWCAGSIIVAVVLVIIGILTESVFPFILISQYVIYLFFNHLSTIMTVNPTF